MEKMYDNKPMRPAEHMAAKGKGKKTATPAMASEMSSHVPVRGESAMAAPKGRPVDGLGTVMTPMNDRDQIMGRKPVSAEPMRPAGRGNNKGA